MQDNDNDSSVEPAGSPSPSMSQVLSPNPTETLANQQRELGQVAIEHSVSDGTKPASQAFCLSGAQSSSQTSYGDGRDRSLSLYHVTRPTVNLQAPTKLLVTWFLAVSMNKKLPTCPISSLTPSSTWKKARSVVRVPDVVSARDGWTRDVSLGAAGAGE
ncbi:hypothetical protein DVH05_008785 [Phytophthora capsici]|nr:hypothetical protein DVH05_008785 [Phytophthora capsici]